MKVLSNKLNMVFGNNITIRKLGKYKRLNNDITKYYIHIFNKIKVVGGVINISWDITSEKISLYLNLFHIYLVICILVKIPKCNICDKLHELFITNTYKI